MDGEVRRLKKSWMKACVWLLFLLIVATGSTYAWFTFSGMSSTNVTPMAGTVSEGDAVLLISSAATGPFDKTCGLVLTGDPDSLSPLSTADLQQFYQATAQNRQGISVLYESTDADEAAVHGIVYLQCRNAACDVYFNKEELNLGSDAQALAAMRLGLKITLNGQTQTFLFKLDDLSSGGNIQSVQTIPRTHAVVSSISSDGRAVYVDDPAQEIGSYLAVPAGAGSSFTRGGQRLVRLAADEIATVEYWLYMEGCDEQCSNAAQNRNSQLRLAFAGTDVGNE